MSETVVAILLGAVLVVVFGLVPHRSCTGHCAGCTGSCGAYKEDEGDHHV